MEDSMKKSIPVLAICLLAFLLIGMVTPVAARQDSGRSRDTGLDPFDIEPVSLTIYENVSVSDSSDLLPPAVMTVDESIKVSDTPGLIGPALLTVSENISVSDSPGLVEGNSPHLIPVISSWGIIALLSIFGIIIGFLQRKAAIKGRRMR
jgi:hypothetical protein